MSLSVCVPENWTDWSLVVGQVQEEKTTDGVGCDCAVSVVLLVQQLTVFICSSDQTDDIYTDITNRTGLIKAYLLINVIYTDWSVYSCYMRQTDSNKKMSKRRVRFQTSVEESDESEAMRIFLQFERGQSGHLDLKEFKQAVAELDLTNKAKVPPHC